MVSNRFLDLIRPDHQFDGPEGQWPVDEVLADLERLRSMPEAGIRQAIVDHCPSILAAEAESLARQIAHETDIQIDHQGDGQVLVGTERKEKRFTLFFEKGRPAGYHKITQPCSLSHNLTSARAVLPRKVKLLFINVKSPNYPMITAPLGIITLGGYLKQTFGEQVSIAYIDMQLADVAAMRRQVMEFRPDLIGLSVKTGGVQHMRELLDQIIALGLQPEPLVVLGNAVPTYASEYILRQFPGVVCVIGRGEPAIKALTAHVAHGRPAGDFFQIPNSAFVSENTIHQIDGVSFNLADLGLPDWRTLFDSYPVSSYQEIWVEASRGCPQKKGGVGCSFCAIMPNNDSQDWWARPSSRVCEEIALMAQLGATHIRFADEEFMAGQTINALKLATEMARLKEALSARGLCMPTFDFAIRVDDVYKRGLKEQQLAEVSPGVSLNNNEVRRLALATFKEAGLIQVYLGLESGSQQQLKRMYKAAIPEDNRKAIEVLRELGLQVAGGWIMIDPLMEGPIDLAENIAFLEANRLIPERLTDDFVTNPINRMRILEGSPMVGIMRKCGLLGARQESLVEYEFSYKDSRLAEIDQTLSIWEREFLALVYALKSRVAVAALEQNTSGQLEHLATYYFSLKRLDFEFFKELVAVVFSATPTRPADTVARFRLKRANLIYRLLEDLNDGLIEDASGTLSAGLQCSGDLTSAVGGQH